jgi:hypothetical protein
MREKFKAACSADIQKFCAQIDRATKGAMRACLQAHEERAVRGVPRLVGGAGRRQGYREGQSQAASTLRHWRLSRFVEEAAGLSRIVA